MCQRTQGTHPEDFTPFPRLIDDPISQSVTRHNPFKNPSPELRETDLKVPPISSLGVQGS